MARPVPGPYQPRCAIEDPDVAFLDDTSAPRRATTRSRYIRGGIAVGAAGIVGAIAVTAPGLATSASASNQNPVATPTATPLEARVGTTDAFAARGAAVSRDLARDGLEVDAATRAAAERAHALEAVSEQVSRTQAGAAAQSRTESLSTAGRAIDAEAKRLASIKFAWPTEGGISSAWGMRMHPILRYTRLHGGSDIGGAVGAPIVAVADGVVTKAAMGYNGGSGNNVRINHGTMDGEAIESSYLHMNSLDVAEGQKVKKGQQIGTVGNTGLSTAPHLHFSIYVNGVNTDPEPYIRQG